MEAIVAQEIKSLLPYFMKHKNVWANYDQEADILYMHFRKPNRADYSEMTEDEMIVRYENNEVIGVTVLNASKR
jgi:uncharacterized protein YuzE